MDEAVIRNLISANGVMRAISPGATEDFRSHPLELPYHEESEAIVDYTVLKVRLPLELRGKPRSLVEELMWPVSDLCKRHGREMALGKWDYRWWYLELLDRDGEFEPVCWISTELFHTHFHDELRTHWILPNVSQKVGYSRQMQTMDQLGHLPGHGGCTAEQLTKEWRDWLARIWDAHESDWLKDGLLDYGRVAPWSSQLEYDGLPDYQAPQWTNDHEGEIPLWRDRASTGYEGLYWRAIPLYDRSQIRRVWDAMKRELYLTSVFNPAAKPTQDRKLWARLKERFPGKIEHMTRRQYAIRLREQRVLEWHREGKNGWEIARLLVSRGLYPMDAEEQARTGALAGSHDDLVEYARRVVARIKKRLVDDGLIEKGKPGRPRKRGE